MPCPAFTEDSFQDLLARFAAVRDPRHPRGIRHTVQVILAIAALAAMSGARSYVAIWEWARDAPQWVLKLVGARWHQLLGRFVAPHESTLRRTIQAFDAQLLDAVICGWIAQQAGTKPQGPRRPAIAVDGKVVRGAWRPDGTQVQLLSAISHDTAVVLAQREIAAKTNEIPELPTLLADLDLTGQVISADALHTQRESARHLVADRGADYVLTVKGNQPNLWAAAQKLLSGPAADFAPEHITLDRGHGRTEQRTTRVAAVTSDSTITFPYAAQVFRIRRDVGGLDGQRTTKEIAHCITSLTPEQATPEDLAAYIRGHWQIENRLHWVRDASFEEDKSQIRTGSGPHVMAIIRNLAISALRLHGYTNIAEALRWTARDPSRPLKILGIT